MKTILLSAAASLMMVGAAAASGGGGPGNAFERATVPSQFVANIPAVDTGSQAYPTTRASGSDQGVIIYAPHFNLALLHHPDTGGQQMPVGLR